MNSYQLDEFKSMLEELYETLFLGYGIAELSVAGILLLVAVIAAIASFLVSVVLYVLEAVPLYMLAKKTGRKYAWLAWVPVFGSYFRLYVLADIAGEKEVTFFNGKYTIQSRSMSFWIYVGIALFGSAAVSVLIGVLNFIPVVGQIAGSLVTVLYLLPTVACGLIEYVYLRDVLDLFKKDRKANQTAAVVITVLDSVVTCGFARMICLYTLLKREPIPQI